MLVETGIFYVSPSRQGRDVRGILKMDVGWGIMVHDAHVPYLRHGESLIIRFLPTCCPERDNRGENLMLMRMPRWD